MSAEAPRRRVLAKDVARVSGVSQATVSYVLNNTPGQVITPATRERVLSAAQQLGYVPNSSAQMLAGGRSRFVILATGEIPRSDLAAQLELTSVNDLHDHGFVPVIDRTDGEGGYASLVALTASLQPAAVIASAPFPEDVKEELLRAGAARILTTFSDTQQLLQAVADTGAAQVRHLVERGHRALVFVAPTEPSAQRLVEARRRGVASECTRNNVQLVEPVRWNKHLPDLIVQMRQVVVAHSEVTAVVAYDDHIALAVYAAAQALGLSIPARLAVIGADDLELGTLISPTLSTTRYQAAGTQAASFAAVLRSGEPLAFPLIRTTIVARQST